MKKMYLKALNLIYIHVNPRININALIQVNVCDKFVNKVQCYKIK